MEQDKDHSESSLIKNHTRDQQCQVKHHSLPSLFIMTPACSLVGLRLWQKNDHIRFKAIYAVLGKLKSFGMKPEHVWSQHT